MPIVTRFQDQNLSINHFYKNVLVECPSCAKKANSHVNFETKMARLLCDNCGYNKQMPTSINSNTSMEMAANMYFKATPWLSAKFKNNNFLACNYEHLNYLQAYISATLREHKNREHFTLLEKLPKFYHEAKNRIPLLKIIEHLKNK